MRIHHLMVAVALVGCGGGDDPVVVQTTDTGFDGTIIPVGTYEDVIIEEGVPQIDSILLGSFWPYPGYEATGVKGQAQLVRWLDGRTEISVGAGNLSPNTTYSVHVHTQPCDYYAGPHYKLDPSIEETEADNELWPDLSTNGSGIASSVIETGWVRGDAMSVVIHDPATNDKMACADLSPTLAEGVAADGTMAPFAYAEPVDETITGTARVVISAQSRVELDLSGLDPAATYAAHVHALPCDTLDGGGHYKLDPTEEYTLEDNELWPDTLVGPDGTIASTLYTEHRLREDAQSVVLHRVAGAESPKVACADLERTAYLAPTRTGSPVLLENAEGYGVDDLSGTISLTRRLDGVTEATLDLEGLGKREVYPVHLHNAPCSAFEAGDHYLIDPTVGGVVESNELWLSFTSKPKGGGKRTVAIPHLVRAEAMAFILHHADGARLACIDLQ
jgi:hypothetical protein